ncbi:MAG: flagellar filament capping protein FliD [Massilia sp.]
MTATAVGASAQNTKPAASAPATSPAISPEIAAQVKQALAPATANVAQLNNALAQGQAKLSGLGQLKSAIADFQKAAASLTAKPASTAADASTAATAAPADPSAKLHSFVSAFNTLAAKLQSLQQGSLKADPALKQISEQLGQMLRDTGSSSNGAALAKAGISVDGSGMMKLDEKKLAASLASDPAGVAGLLAPGGRGPVDQLASRLGTFTTDNGPVAREAAATGHAVTVLETKKSGMSKVITAQATALAAFYTQQANASSNGPSSLFDMLA